MKMNLRKHQAIAALLTIVLLIGAFGSFNVNAQRRSRGFHRGPHHSRAKGALIGAAASAFVRSKFSASLMSERYLSLVSRLARQKAVWEPEVKIPVPLGCSPAWFYQGVGRSTRRILKRASSFMAV